MSEDNSVALQRIETNSESLEDLWTDYKGFRKAVMGSHSALTEAGLQEAQAIAELSNRLDKLEQRLRWVTVALFAGILIALLVPAMV